MYGGAVWIMAVTANTRVTYINTVISSRSATNADGRISSATDCEIRIGSLDKVSVLVVNGPCSANGQILG